MFEKFREVNLEIEYDYNFQRNNPNLHFNFEIIENQKTTLLK